MDIPITIILGLLVSLAGGIVSSCHQYSKERKNLPPTFDFIDFVILIISGTFSGFMGFLLASWKLEEANVILVVTGLSAIGGYSMLISLSNIMLDVLKSTVNRKD